MRVHDDTGPLTAGYIFDESKAIGSRVKRNILRTVLDGEVDYVNRWSLGSMISTRTAERHNCYPSTDPETKAREDRLSK
jgi:hypothetical protein